jgi:hypothetical protein
VRLHEPDGYEAVLPHRAGHLFHFRSKPFLHFHNGPDRTYADVRFGGDFEPFTASTPKQREVLLEQVKAQVTAELASRQRKCG